MASITKLLRRQPQTSEAELEYVRERTVARLHGLNGEVDAGDASAVAQAIVLDAPAESVAAPEAPTTEPEAVVEAVAEPEAPTIQPEAVIEAAAGPEAVIEAPVVELEPKPASVLAPVPEAVIEPEPEPILEPEPEPILEAEAVVAESEPVLAETEPVVAEAVIAAAVIAEPEPEPKTPSFLAEAMAAAAIRAHGKPPSQPEPEPVAAEPEPELVAVVEPEVVSEARPAPKRSRRWWSSSKPEPEVVVEPEAAAVVEAELEPVAVEPEVEAIVEPEPIVELEAVVEPEPEALVEPVVVVEPEPDRTPIVEAAAIADPEPVVAAAPEPDPEPVAIPVVVDRVVDIKRESIWEAKLPEAPKPTVKRAKPARQSTSLPVAKPAAVAAAPAPGSAFCPYCALSLVPAPTATRRCPRCRQRIIVKHVQGHIVFLTEASVAVFDAERQRAVDGVRWAKERTSWLKLAAGVAASPDKVARLERARLTEAAVTSSRQLYMSTAERAFKAAKREDRWEIASRIRREQAAAIHKAAGSSIPPPAEALALHREAAAVELRGINKMAKSVQLIGSNCCQTCEADDGRTFRIVTEMRETRLPHADCPKGLCRCRWDLVVRDEAMVRRYLQRKDRGSRGKRAGVDPAVRSGE
jgi:hypothetical protein